MTTTNTSPNRSILMVAYHFPPASGSSGHLRTLSFVRELPRFGWHPIVMTASHSAYPAAANSTKTEVPNGLQVYRAPALDAARHLAFRGRYLRRTALPDRWANWLLSAIPLGLALITRYRPKILWTTYPIATAHLIGMALHKATGIPWIADFRDPMIEVDPHTGQHYPPEPDLWKMRNWIESRVMKHCRRAIFVSPGALKICAERYAALPAKTLAMVPNGYDEESFARVEETIVPQPKQRGPIVLLHSGLLYPTPDRDPKDFFAALAKLNDQNIISSDTLQVVLRASGYEDHYRVQIAELRLQQIVHLEPPKPYSEALAEMLTADGLLVFQGYTSNPAIPTKLYEYLRARRPIFAMVHKDGDTAAVLRAERIGRIVPLDSCDEIAAGLRQFLSEVREGTALVASLESIRKHSRQARAAEFAGLLEEVVN
jgi:glycosyltransferase involved in cell wall biosynthesis